MRIFLLAISLLLSLAGYGQVRPDDFPFEDAPDDTNFEFYSQKNGVNTKTNPSAFRKTMLPKVGQQVSYVPTATGNAQNRGEFVWGGDGELYYIDAQGRSARFVSTGQADQMAEITGPLNSGNSVVVMRQLPADRDRVKVSRSGMVMTESLDFRWDGQSIVFLHRSFSFGDYVVVVF